MFIQSFPFSPKLEDRELLIPSDIYKNIRYTVNIRKKPMNILSVENEELIIKTDFKGLKTISREFLEITLVSWIRSKIDEYDIQNFTIQVELDKCNKDIVVCFSMIRILDQTMDELDPNDFWDSDIWSYMPIETVYRASNISGKYYLYYWWSN